MEREFSQKKQKGRIEIFREEVLWEKRGGKQ